MEKEQIINHVIELVGQDLTNLNKDEKDMWKFVAYRIRAFMLKNTFAKRNARNRTERSNQSEDYEGLHEFLEGLYEADWIELDWRALNNYNFKTIYDNEQEVRDYLGFTQYDFFNLLKQFEGLSQDSEEFAEDFKEVSNELLPLFVEALEYALTKVDTSREVKEQVKYINKAMLTKFIELQYKSQGKIRIYDTKTKTNYYVNPNYEVDGWILMFGKTLKNLGLDSFDLYLTKKQKAFVQSVYDIVERGLKEEDESLFRLGKDSKPVLNKREIAARIGMEETNFKQTLKRCEKKIYDNWKIVMDNHYKK